MDLSRRRTLCGGLSIIASLATFSAHGNAGPGVTVDRLTCAQAQKYVRKYSMYWLATASDGPIPITFVAPVERAQYCNLKEVYAFHRRATLDDPGCLLGVTCRVVN